MRISSKTAILVLECALLAPAVLAGEGGGGLPAFPGAEGFGARCKGGRGGKVIKVTNLESSGPGSLQAALDEKVPRIVVFEVSGVIKAGRHSKGKPYISVGGSNLTIAGQTAPGAGITLDGTLSFRRGGGDVKDSIVRFLRVRAGSDKADCYLKRANIRALETSGSQGLILDHISGSWSLDDCFDLYTATDTTVQWCTDEESDIILEGGDEPHNFGMITGWANSCPRPISVHHTLIANHFQRTPNVGSFPFDFRNNVMYNCGSATIFMFLDKKRKHKSEEFILNLVGNYCRPGPGGLIGGRIYMPPMTTGFSRFDPGKSGRLYVAGNYQEDQGGYAEPWSSKPIIIKEAHPFPPVETQTAEEALELVNASAGCLPRDAVSARTIAEVRTGTGYWGRHTPNAGLMEGLTPGKPPPDGDNDGMPDEWEKAHGLNPADAGDAGKVVPAGASPGDRHKGYTWIEYYINELADLKVAAALTAARLDRGPAKPWGQPADKLAPGAEIHKSVDEMVKAIGEQTSAKGGDTHMGWFAVQQLSRMGEKGRPAVPGLVGILKDPGQEVRTAAFAAWALGAIGPAAADAVPALIKAIDTEYKRPAKSWKPWYVHGFFAWALGRIGPEAKAAIPALVKVMEGRCARSRPPAAWALSRMGPEAISAKAALIKALGQKEGVVYHAARALAGIGEEVVPDLRAALAGGRGAAGAARALGLMGPPARSAAPELVKLADSGDAGARAAAAEALGLLGAPDAASAAALGKLLGDGKLTVRHAAAIALGRAGAAAASAIPQLEKALADARPEVRRAAALALGETGKNAVPALRKALFGTDPLVRRCAARALGAIGPEAADAAGDLAKVLAEEEDATVRREAVWSLALMGPAGKPAAGAVEEARKKDADYVVRYAAAVALERAGSK
jgi:HEAT repeat protein